MRRLIALVSLAVVGCAYQQMHFGLRVTGLTDLQGLACDETIHRVVVYAPEATAALRPEHVHYRFQGVFQAASEPGTFRVTGPGTGSIEVAFMAGDVQHLEATLVAGASAQSSSKAPETASEPPVVPSAAPPSATPDPRPSPLDPEARVLESYRLQEAGDYVRAVGLLVDVTDPDWLPKARVLIGTWGNRAVEQALNQARASLADGNRARASQLLDLVAKLSRRPAQRRAERELRLQLGG